MGVGLGLLALMAVAFRRRFRAVFGRRIGSLGRHGAAEHRAQQRTATAAHQRDDDESEDHRHHAAALLLLGLALGVRQVGLGHSSHLLQAMRTGVTPSWRRPSANSVLKSLAVARLVTGNLGPLVHRGGPTAQRSKPVSMRE